MLALALGLLVAPASADEGYAGDVEKLENSLDEVVQKYSEDGDATNELKTFIQEDWENVEYHEAVEDNHPKKYSAIWIEINGLKKAVDNDAPPSEIAEKAEGVKTALRDGLEALEEGAPTESGETDASEGGGDNAEATLDRIRNDLDHAVAEYAEGEPNEAKDIIGETYLSNFEGLEGDLIEKNPDLVTDLEIDFNSELPGLMDEDASLDEVKAKVDEMKTKLDQAEQLLQEQTGDEVFGTGTPRTETSPGDGEAGDAPGFGIVAAMGALLVAVSLKRLSV